MRWCRVPLIVVSLLLAQNAVAHAQGGGRVYLPSLKVVPRAPILEVLPETTSDYYDSDRLIIVGLIKNTGNADAVGTTMAIDLLDANGNLLDTGTGFVADSIIQPGGTSCFELTVDTPPRYEDIATIQPKITFGVDSTQLYDLLVFDLHEDYEDTPGYLSISGQARNNLQFPVTIAFKSATVYSGPNHTGRVLRCEDSFIMFPIVLSPGEDTPIFFSFWVEGIDIGSVHIKVKANR